MRGEERICCVGAGLSGAVIARVLAEHGYAVLVAEARGHIAGNCHTERDPATGVMVHRYGPHIFHTDNEKVWRFICRFGDMRPYVHRVKAIAGGRVYSLPINLHTINQFFDTCMSPKEARAFLQSQARSEISTPRNFEEQALALIGERLYVAFFRGYTKKQWGREPSTLPASVLKRLPVRFNYEDSYFDHRYQAIPAEGYTNIVARILDHPLIELRCNCSFEELTETFRHVFWSGPIDRWFGERAGRLAYRTLDFERIETDGDFQGTAVMNYCDETVPFTRISEHKHFTPWEKEHLPRTVAFREYAREAGPSDIPFYPVRLAEEERQLAAYVSLAWQSKGVTFVGRLGTYRYLDMDQAIAEAIAVGEAAAEQFAASIEPPPFFHDHKP